MNNGKTNGNGKRPVATTNSVWLPFGAAAVFALLIWSLVLILLPEPKHQEEPNAPVATTQEVADANQPTK